MAPVNIGLYIIWTIKCISIWWFGYGATTNVCCVRVVKSCLQTPKILILWSKHSPRAWFGKFRKVIQQLVMAHCKVDHPVFFRQSPLQKHLFRGVCKQYSYHRRWTRRHHGPKATIIPTFSNQRLRPIKRLPQDRSGAITYKYWYFSEKVCTLFSRF